MFNFLVYLLGWEKRKYIHTSPRRKHECRARTQPVHHLVIPLPVIPSASFPAPPTPTGTRGLCSRCYRAPVGIKFRCWSMKTRGCHGTRWGLHSTHSRLLSVQHYKDIASSNVLQKVYFMWKYSHNAFDLSCPSYNAEQSKVRSNIHYYSQFQKN